MLDIDIRPAGQSSAVVVMAASARGAVGQISGAKSHRVTMRMAVKIVRRMTLAAIASRCDRSVGGRVMTTTTRIMFLVVGRVDEVGVIDGLGMTAAAFGLLRHLGRMVLGRMRRKVTDHTGMTLATITGRGDRSVRCRVVAGGTTVVLDVVGRIDKGRVINRRTVTAATTGRLGHQERMILRCMRRKVACDAAVTLRTVTRCGARQLGRHAMADVTVVMLDGVGRIHKGRVIDRRAMTAGTTGRLGHQERVVFGVRGPVSRLAVVTCRTINRTGGDGAVGCMARSTGVMFLVIRRVDEALTRGHRCRMTARTLAVQGDIAVRLVINVMIHPVATRMTGRTDIRAARNS